MYDTPYASAKGSTGVAPETVRRRAYRKSLSKSPSSRVVTGNLAGALGSLAVIIGDVML
jgi:hypothetical protein